jgi:hypothetical protein
VDFRSDKERIARNTKKTSKNTKKALEQDKIAHEQELALQAQQLEYQRQQLYIQQQQLQQQRQAFPVSSAPQVPQAVEAGYQEQGRIEGQTSPAFNIACPNCAAPNSVEAAFCIKCGTKIEQTYLPLGTEAEGADEDG